MLSEDRYKSRIPLICCFFQRCEIFDESVKCLSTFTACNSVRHFPLIFRRFSRFLTPFQFSFLHFFLTSFLLISSLTFLFLSGSIPSGKIPSCVGLQFLVDEVLDHWGNPGFISVRTCNSFRRNAFSDTKFNHIFKYEAFFDNWVSHLEEYFPVHWIHLFP